MEQQKKLAKNFNRKNSFFIIGLFFLGFIIALYPISAQVYNIYLQHQDITTFEKKRREMRESLGLTEKYVIGHVGLDLQKSITNL